MKEKEFYLDGEENGFLGLDQDNNIISISNKYMNQILYKNLDLLKASFERNRITNYRIYVVLNLNHDDQMMISLNHLLQPSPDYYEYIDIENNEYYTICLENPKEVLTCYGYFTFTDNPDERIQDYNTGVEQNNIFYNALMDAISTETRKGSIMNTSIDQTHVMATYIEKRRIYGSSLNLRIMKGYELVRINKFRREFEFKVFPFKNVDKYKNIYFAFSKYNNEKLPDKIFYDKSYEILNNVRDYLKDKYPELNPNYFVISTRPVYL